MMAIYWLNMPDCRDPARVGGKAANLGRLAAAHPVPPGFCLAASEASARPSVAELADAYARLGDRCGTPHPRVAVRSSAVDEDGALASFAGQHESYLNVVGVEAVAEAVQRCLESAHTERALHYRRSHNLREEAGVAVLVQQLVLADVSAVVFSADPCTGARDRIVINATWGLGESLVGGTVTPDLYVVDKRSLTTLEQRIAEKVLMTVVSPEGTREVPVPRCMQSESALTADQILALAHLARTLEETQGWPVDLECAFQNEHLYLLQCRPITTLDDFA